MNTLGSIQTTSVADTLSNQVVPDSLRGVALVVETKAEDIFGDISTIATPEMIGIVNEYTWTNNIVFQYTVFLMFILYIIFIYKNQETLPRLFSNLSWSKNRVKTTFNIKKGSRQAQTISVIQLLGFAFFGLSIIRYAEAVLPLEVLNKMPAEITPLLIPSVIAMCIAIVSYQLIILNTVGWMTFTTEIIKELIYIKRVVFSIFIITTAPLVLFYVLSSQKMGVVWYYAILTLVGLLIIWFLLKSITLFISKKIPILQWFLYLCCVEFIPISYIVVIITRY